MLCIGLHLHGFSRWERTDGEFCSEKWNRSSGLKVVDPINSNLALKSDEKVISIISAVGEVSKHRVQQITPPSPRIFTWPPISMLRVHAQVLFAVYHILSPFEI